MKGEEVLHVLSSYHCADPDPLPELPVPHLPYITKLKSKPAEEPPRPPMTPQSRETTKQSSPPKSRRLPNDAYDSPEADPWASPATQKPSNSAPPNQIKPNPIPDFSSNRTNGLNTRTTSAFTTHGASPEESSNEPSGNSAQSGAPGWNSYNGGTGGFSDQPTLGGGFASGGDDQHNGGGGEPRRSLGTSAVLPRGAEETVTITMLPEKEGVFMFQHRNYEVKCLRKNSTVVRRYSDFVWLLDCLHKRYPFRLLPLLPPKRVGGESNIIPSYFWNC